MTADQSRAYERRAYEMGYQTGTLLGDKAAWLSPFEPFSGEDIAWRLGVMYSLLAEKRA